MEENPSPQEINTLVNLFNDGRLAEAATLARKMTVRFPMHGFGWMLLGAVFKQMGRSADALLPMQKAAALSPNAVESHYNLGVILQDLSRLDEAEASYRRALQIKPDYAEGYNNLGITIMDMNRPDEAEVSYRRALEIEPDYAEGYNNLGITLRSLGRLNEAEASYRRALQIKPNYVEALSNLGFILQNMGRLNEAEASYRRALQIKPDYAEAQCDLSLVFLALGQFQRGWQGYEMRWKLKDAKHLLETPYPCWLGEEDIAGKKLLIQFEQGLGDAIQMLRYIHLLEQKNVECWIQAPNSLHRLIVRSFPLSKVIERKICPDGLDYQIPAMSLPLAMQTFSEQSIPRHVPYLIPDDDRVSFWEKQIASTRSRTVGLVWRGNPKHGNDRNRSASLMDFLPLIAACESIQFVTLQKDITDAERNAFKDYNNTCILDDELTDFDETAAVMCNMDVVISVDTAPAHLSGALGKSTWLLLSSCVDWRWMADRADSPWYPTAKLFRQKSIGNWAEVVINVKASLAELDSQAR